MQSYPFISHIQRDEAGNVIEYTLLREHLKGVGELTKRYLDELPYPADWKEQWRPIFAVTGYGHDLGKYNPYFQEYIWLNKDTGQKKSHSLLSAFLTAHIVSKKYDLNPEKILLIFGAILLHHDHLKNFWDDWKDHLEEWQEDPFHSKPVCSNLFKTQIPALLNQPPEVQSSLEREISELFEIDFSLREFANDVAPDGPLFNRILEALSDLEDLMYDKKGKPFITHLYLLYSSLIDSDKRHAAKISSEQNQRPELTHSILEEFRKKTFSSDSRDKIKNLRESIYRELLTKAENLPEEQKLFTLTAPTGSGKTLSPLSFALKLREKIQKTKGYTPRIIYTLPFTSIIEQTHAVFEKVFQLHPDFANSPSSILLKHHHLADVEYKKKNAELPLDQAMLMIESWDSEVIVTTYWQLFHTLWGYKNRHLKKFHSLVGSILILDEVQTLPLQYLGFLRKVFQWAAQELGCYIIFMTATQPVIWQAGEAIELLDNPQHYFNQLNRTQWTIDLSEQTIPQFAEYFSEKYDPSLSYLIVLNTIRSSIEVYREIEGIVADRENLFYLSSNIVPKQRREIIAKIKELQREQIPAVLVSTQVVEAGVDLDFNCVFRDFAPLDSLIQAAGRANRENKRTLSEVVVFKLREEEKNRTYASMIYSSVNLDIAQRLLAEKRSLQEREFFELITQNYRELVNRQGLNSLEEIFQDWVERGRSESLDKFQLIEQRGVYYDVFLSIDQTAEEIWREYLTKVYREREFQKRWTNYLALRKFLRDYIISIPQQYIAKHFWDYANGDVRKIGYIPLEMIESYYHPKLGYSRFFDNEEDLIIF